MALVPILNYSCPPCSVVSPKRVVGCTGWDSVCWGVLGILLLEKFIGSLFFWISRFPAFSVSKFLGFEVSFLLVSKFWRCHKYPFHVFWKISIPYPRFSRFLRRIFGDFGAHLFQHVLIFMFKIYKNDTRQICPREISWFGLGVLVSPTIKNGFGSQGHVRKFQNHRNEGLWVLP